jgi:hypothetical protein
MRTNHWSRKEARPILVGGRLAGLGEHDARERRLDIHVRGLEWDGILHGLATSRGPGAGHRLGLGCLPSWSQHRHSSVYSSMPEGSLQRWWWCWCSLAHFLLDSALSDLRGGWWWWREWREWGVAWLVGGGSELDMVRVRTLYRGSVLFGLLGCNAADHGGVPG